MAKETVSVSHNALAFGSTIKGEIVTDNDIRIDGTVEGNINCKGKVVIGAKGNIIGDITCANAEIIGTITGNLKIHESLTIQATAKVNGNINTNVLIVEPNALFNGSCKMGEKKEAVIKN